MNYSFTAFACDCSWATEKIEYPKNGTFATLLPGAWTFLPPGFPKRQDFDCMSKWIKDFLRPDFYIIMPPRLGEKKVSVCWWFS